MTWICYWAKLWFCSPLILGIIVIFVDLLIRNRMFSCLKLRSGASAGKMGPAKWDRNCRCITNYAPCEKTELRLGYRACQSIGICIVTHQQIFHWCPHDRSHRGWRCGSMRRIRLPFRVIWFISHLFGGCDMLPMLLQGIFLSHSSSLSCG